MLGPCFGLVATDAGEARPRPHGARANLEQNFRPEAANRMLGYGPKLSYDSIT